MKHLTRRCLSLILGIVLSLAFFSLSYALQGLERQMLLDRYGNELIAYLNPITKSPHRIMGQGVKIDRYFASAGSLEKSNVEAISRRLITDYKDLLQVKMSDLDFKEASQGSGNWYVTFQQRHQGVPVYRAYVSFTVDPNWNIILMGSDFHPQIEVSTKPLISGDRATDIARERFGSFDTTVDEQPLLLIFLKETDDSIRYHLTWRLRLSSQKPSKSVIYFIDAMEGTVVEEWSAIANATRRIYGTVKGKVYPEYYLDDLVARDFRHEKVKVCHVSGLAASGNTNTNGYYNLTWNGSYQYYWLYSYLDGPYVKVLDDDGGESEHVWGGVIPNPTLEHNWTWDQDYEENTVFYHINIARDHLSNFRTISYKVEAHVDATISALAQCWPDGKIEFNKEYVGAQTSDIIYHEYGHYFQYNIYGDWIDPSYSDYSQGSAMMEGFADYVAVTINNDPDCGEHCTSETNYDNTKKYPDDFMTSGGSSAKYYNGEIIGGAVWDVREQLGQLTTDALWVEAMEITPHPDDFFEFCDNMILADDNDGNLENGTPHDTQIIDAFANHGINPSYIYVPGNYSTIQAGINAAERYGYGVTVMVSSGAYNEQVSMKEDVDVRAVDYANPSNTVIDVGLGYTTAVSFDGIANARLRGFTLRGYAAVYCSDSSSPAPSGNVIWDCVIHDSEHGVYCTNSSPRLKGTTITNCTCGLMQYDSSNPILREPWGLNTIEGSGQAARCITGSKPELGVYSFWEWGRNNILTSGYDIYISSSNPEGLTIYAQKNWWGGGNPSIYFGKPSWEVIWQPALSGPAGKVVASGSADPGVEQYRGSSLLLSKGDYSEAIAGFKGVIEEYPLSMAAEASLTELIFAYREMGAERECLAYLEETAQRHWDIPLGGTALRASVSVLRRLDLGQKALDRVSELLDRFRDTKWERDLLFSKGMIYKHNLKAHEKATAVFEEFVRSYPEDIVADFAKLELGYDPTQSGREKPGAQAVSTVSLSQNTPNPFNAQTVISFALPQSAFVRLEVYNILGQKVRTLSETQMKAGKHSAIWDGKDSSGREVSSGIYLYCLKTDGEILRAKKMLLLK